MAGDADNAIPTDVSKMTKVQKLAGLLIVIGPEAASQVMKNLEEHELEGIATEMAKYTMITQEMQDALTSSEEEKNALKRQLAKLSKKYQQARRRGGDGAAATQLCPQREVSLLGELGLDGGEAGDAKRVGRKGVVVRSRAHVIHTEMGAQSESRLANTRHPIVLLHCLCSITLPHKQNFLSKTRSLDILP